MMSSLAPMFSFSGSVCGIVAQQARARQSAFAQLRGTQAGSARREQSIYLLEGAARTSRVPAGPGSNLPAYYGSDSLIQAFGIGHRRFQCQIGLLVQPHVNHRMTAGKDDDHGTGRAI